jgi:two-component system, OmpR family, sensor histidine kinase KdpD
MVEDALLRAGPLLEGHPVEVAIASGLPSPKVDPRLISQVIFTLLENAAKYSGGSAKITVSVRQKENNICFAVDDEGPGIPSELRGKVFDKFFRAGLQPGLGMGLAIARGIVQAHGGKIWIEDGPDRRGTSVKFMVPLSDAPVIHPLKNEVPQNDVSQRDVPRNDDAAAPGSPRVVTSGEHS